MTKETHTIELATKLTIAWLTNPNTRTSADELPAVLKSMHDAVDKLSASAESDTGDRGAESFPQAVSVRKSLANRNHIISMIDGKPYKLLRRHLTTHGLTPDEYRARYNLRPDYPMVAAAYGETRRAMAKAIGLGRKSKSKPEPAPDRVAVRRKRGRKGAVSADAQ